MSIGSQDRNEIHLVEYRVALGGTSAVQMELDCWNPSRNIDIFSANSENIQNTVRPEKMKDALKTTFSNAFLLNMIFRLNCDESFF